MIKEQNQQIHEDLIDFLNSNLKSTNGTPMFHKVPSTLSTDKFNQISIDDINKAVKVLVHFLNLNGGSNSDVDLYELLQVYLRNYEQRQKINKLVKEVVYK
jgi:hypothetical protein